MKKILFFTFFLLHHITALAQPYLAGQTYFGQKKYIEYRAGNLPIILVVPHGGALKPSEIPDRNCTDCSYLKDSYTLELARAIDSAFYQLTNCSIHLIINHLHRSKLDANREIVEAADGSPIAEQAWTEFHTFIGAAKKNLTQQYQKGIYIDLHGHAHEKQRLELGYLLYANELQKTDTELDANYTKLNSIKNLVANNPNQQKLSALLRGSDALGTLFANANYPAVPSQQDPAPLIGDSYFSGGYNTNRYGSINGGTLDAIQIECNSTNVRDNATNRNAFAAKTAIILKEYLEKHYFLTGFSCLNALENSAIKQEEGLFFQKNLDCWHLQSEDTTPYEVNFYAVDGALLQKTTLQQGDCYQPTTLPNGLILVRLKAQNGKITVFKCVK